MTDSAPFRSIVAVRWSDFDQYGHVNNTAYLEYAQQARVDFMTRGVREGMPASVVRRMEIDYIRAILPDTREVIVDTEILEFGRTSYKLRQSVIDQHGHLTAVLDFVMVLFDLESAQAIEIPAATKQELERYRIVDAESEDS